MKFLLFFSFVFFTVFSYSQTVKIVARKNCQVTKPCPANSSGSGILWSGIKIYDWHDHDNNPSTLDTLGWSQCVEKTVVNSGQASVIEQDNCPCNTGFTKTPAVCTGQTSCTCEQSCNKTCTEHERLNPSTCACECRTRTDPFYSVDAVCPAGHIFSRQTCGCECNLPDSYCTGNLTINYETCACECKYYTSYTRPSGLFLDEPIRCNPEVADFDPSTCTCTCRNSNCTAPFVANPDLGCGCTCPSCPKGEQSMYNFITKECICTIPNPNPSPPPPSPSPPSQPEEEEETCPACPTGQTATGSPPDNCECIPVDSSISCNPICGSCEICSRGRCVAKDCGECKRCSNGRCVNVPNQSWQPALTSSCGMVTQTRCYGGVHRTRTKESRKKDCPKCTSDSDCGSCETCRNGKCVSSCGACEKCSNNQCVAKANCCTSNSDCGACEKCSSNQCVAKANCCTSNSDCGACEKCSSNQCVAKTNCCSPDTNWTAWSPAWDPADHYTNESQEQTRSRCHNSTPETGSQTLTGTKVRCSPEVCTPENKTCSGGAIQSPTGSGEYICKNGRVDRSKCVYSGSYTPSSCPDCTPRSASDCPSSFPNYRNNVCYKCRFGKSNYILPGGSEQCCPHNPSTSHPCRRIVEVASVGNNSISNICNQ